MGNDTMKISEVVARNAAAEKAMADAIQILEEALSDAAELPEMERAEVYAERLGAVRRFLGQFVKISPLGVLAEEFGLKLKRYASDDEIRLIGVRVSHINEQEVRKIWEIMISRRDRSAEIVCNGEIVMYLRGSTSVGSARIEKCAVSSLLRILNEKKRCALHRSRAAKEAK